MAQLFFDFQTDPSPQALDAQDFVLTEENSAAFNFLKKFFAQDHFARAHFPSLILKGTHASGKSHMLHFFAKKHGAEFLDFEKISNINPNNFFSRNRFYVLENISEISDEESLLHIINSASESGSFLILSATNFSRFHLRDLCSRLKNIFAVEIKNPSLETTRQLLASGLARRQIKLSGKIINLISEKILRDYSAIFATVKMIELRCHEKGKAISLVEAAEIFK